MKLKIELANVFYKVNKPVKFTKKNIFFSKKRLI